MLGMISEQFKNKPLTIILLKNVGDFMRPVLS